MAGITIQLGLSAGWGKGYGALNKSPSLQCEQNSFESKCWYIPLYIFISI